MVVLNNTSAAFAMSSELSSLQSQVKALRTIAGLSLAGVIILVVIVSIHIWGSHHNQRPKKANISRDLGTDHIPDPSVFELGNINRSNSSHTGSSNDHSSRTIAYGNFSSPKSPEPARAYAPTSHPAQNQRAASSHSMHNTPSGATVDQDFPVPHSHTIHAPVPQRLAPGQVIFNLSNEDRRGRRSVFATPPAMTARATLPSRSSEPAMPPAAVVGSQRKSRPTNARISNTEQSFGTDYTRTRRAGRFDDEYFNEQSISNSRDLTQGKRSSSRQGGSRAQRMLARINNQ